MDFRLNHARPMKILGPASHWHPLGFTLVEVMVALAILSIALTSIYRLHGQTMDISAQARFWSQAPLLAQGKLAETERQGFNDSAEHTGDFGQAYPDYTWTVAIEEIPSELIKDDHYHLIRLDITISQGPQHTYHLRTYRFHAD